MPTVTNTDLLMLIQVLQAVGPWGLLIYIYWKDRKDLAQAIDRYEQNVTLVKSYEKLANALADVITLNTQHLTRVEDKIDANQYCPQVRVRKIAKEDMV